MVHARFRRARSAVLAAFVAVLAFVHPARAGLPFIESVEPPSACAGQSVHVRGVGFGEVQGLSTITLNGLHHTEAITYWSDQRVIFTLPHFPGLETVDVGVLRDLLTPSNPVPLGLDVPATVTLLSPPPGRVIRTMPVTFRAAPEFDHGTVTSVAFEYRVPPDPSWTLLGTDHDGAGPAYGTTTFLGTGDGWSATLDLPLPECDLEIRATATNGFGQVMTGTALYRFDPTPLAPRLLEGVSLGTSVFDGDALDVELEFTDAQIESLLLVLLPIHWHHRRTLAHGDQDTMDITDKNGNDVSDQACGPVAAAACLKWFGADYPGLAQDLEELAKKIAKDAGTGSHGTYDDELVAAIKKALKRAGLDPDQWRVTLQSDSSKIWRSMVEGLNRDGFDKILLLQQRSTTDVNGDGQVDSTDVVGHYVTMSSRGTRRRDVATDVPYPQHFIVIEEYVDFMNPATGETEEYRVDNTKQPPEIVGLDLNASTTGEPKVASVICVKPPAPPIPALVPEQLPGTVVAAFAVPGPGIHPFAVPGASLPPGPALITFVGKDLSGAEASDFAWTMVVNAICDVGFGASLTTGDAPLAVAFANTSAPTDSVLGWEWDFEDDGIVDSTDPSPVWLYNAPGVYTVRLRALNAHGTDEKFAPGLIHVTGTTAVGGTPVVTALRGIHPNPFRDGLTVSFALRRGGAAKIEVFGVDGRRVRTLARGPWSAGEHAVSWNGADDRGRALPAGIYFIRLEADGVTRWARAARVE